MHNFDASRCLADLERYRPLIRRVLPVIYDPDDVFQEVCCVAANHVTTSREATQLPRGSGPWLETLLSDVAAMKAIVSLHHFLPTREASKLRNHPRNSKKSRAERLYARLCSQ